MRQAVPISQGKIRKVLSSNGIPTAQNYLASNLGFSLTDHYWINPVKHPLSWEKVDLFTNNYKDEKGGLQFSPEGTIAHGVLSLRHKTIFFASASAQGELWKKWIVQDKALYLIKGNYGFSYQQSINEVIAMLIHQRQNLIPYTIYRLCEIELEDGTGKGCICQGFATEDTEFISAYDVAGSVKKRNDISEYEHYIAVCTANGLLHELQDGKIIFSYPYRQAYH